MSIEIGSKWVKDGKVVEVENIKDNYFNDSNTSRVACVWFWDNKQGGLHVLSERDFLEQYKPYVVVYEYRWAVKTKDFSLFIDGAWHTENEASEVYENVEYQRIDFTKRERK